MHGKLQKQKHANRIERVLRYYSIKVRSRSPNCIVDEDDDDDDDDDDDAAAAAAAADDDDDDDSCRRWQREAT